MKKILLFATSILVGIGFANAAVRDANTISRNQSVPQKISVNSSRAASAPVATASRTNATQSRSAATPVSVSNRATTTQSKARTATSRSATTTVSGPSRNATAARRATPVSRVTTGGLRGAANAVISARAAENTLVTSGPSNTFGVGYNACRDAYFTCMDQFCATANETYRRCVCSSKLSDVQARERALSQAGDQIQDFKDLNIDAISKTAAEVKAMQTATAGEAVAATAKDTSDSAKQLAGISAVLNTSKSKSLSTAGKLDIGGDINAIWATTDFAGGTNLANLTGEPLYNAVHAQCAEMVAGNCGTAATLKMVVSAYGMYIENDCSLLMGQLSKKQTTANATIRETEREMSNARYENYNAHNSTSINDCIAQVRKDITMDTACGADYVHCLDVTGLYLNNTTGEPIYTAEFYQLDGQISLSGDVLTNPANRLYVSTLNRKRPFAARGLDTCRDIADDVWDEFVRQALTEIYQGQQERIRNVRDNCMNVVNDCYDTTLGQLKDFSNLKDQILVGSRLELSEEMCRQKLDTCSNLYGGGADGLRILVSEMKRITDQKIAQGCEQALSEYLQDVCATKSVDTAHSYPYECRMYSPGGHEANVVNADAGGQINDTLYSKLVTYAGQVCIRPSKVNVTQPDELPTDVLMAISSVMDTVRIDMNKVMTAECAKYDGTWVLETNVNVSMDSPAYIEKLDAFYNETSTDEGWGTCTLSKTKICENSGGDWDNSTNSCTCDTGKGLREMSSAAQCECVVGCNDATYSDFEIKSLIDEYTEEDCNTGDKTVPGADKVCASYLKYNGQYGSWDPLTSKCYKFSIQSDDSDNSYCRGMKETKTLAVVYSITEGRCVLKPKDKKQTISYYLSNIHTEVIHNNAIDQGCQLQGGFGG